MGRTCTVGDVEIGPGHRLALIGGPCTLESLELGLAVGRTLRDACADAGLAYVFKASYDKANRTSPGSSRGPGAEAGLDWLGTIQRQLGVPVTTDIHDPAQARGAAEVVDMLQIPAFLCRQTDLLVAAAASSTRAVNVKKGQFLSPAEMIGPVRKLAEEGCNNVLLTERGTFFGYHRLVNDFIGIGDMMELDTAAFSSAGPPPVCFDVTHSTQLPGSGAQTGGRPDRAPMLARAAVASGVHAVFIEAHPDPTRATSDGATQLPLGKAPELIDSLGAIRRALG